MVHLLSVYSGNTQLSFNEKNKTKKVTAAPAKTARAVGTTAAHHRPQVSLLSPRCQSEGLAGLGEVAWPAWRCFLPDESSVTGNG